MQLLIGTDGNVRCVYGEEIDLGELGQLDIRRGSHVEPDENGRWIVDLSPAGGPTLGPFGSRSAALEAERQWLEQNWLSASDGPQIAAKYFSAEASRETLPSI